MLDVRPLFPGASERVYLNTASVALGSRRSADALETAVAEWKSGTFDWIAAEGVGEELRGHIASLLRVHRDDIAFVAGTSGGAATVAAQLPDAAAGANVVVPSRDFASNFLPWMLLRDRGYDVRLVEDVHGELSADAFAKLVDKRTAVIATSLVQSATGYRVDLETLKALAAESGAWLVLDASQAMGSIDIDIDGVDALYSCSHKWLLGTRGIGHLYVRPGLRDSFEPVTPGWKATDRPLESYYGPDMELSKTASKLDASWPWFNPIADIEGLQILQEVGIEKIEAHNMGLIDELEDRGVQIPFSRSSRSPIVSIELNDVARSNRAIRTEGIVASERAGRLRISVHLYNTSDDLERLVDALR